MTSRMIDAALAWARVGWRVFPLVPGGKTPLPKSHGFLDASNDPEVISKMRWEVDGQPCNVGLATGDGLVVLDVDRKNGKDGFASLAKVGLTEAKLNSLCTFRVATPRDGVHYYFMATDTVSSRVDALSGVDVRGDGGYIVAPPSQVDGRPYQASWQGKATGDDIPKLSDLATWSLVAPFLPARPETSQEPFIPPLDDGAFGPKAPPEVIERARRYLRKCPPAVSGNGGHNATFKTASSLVNGFCLDVESALTLLREWNERCQPPWSEKELRHKVYDAAFRGPPSGKLLGWLRDESPAQTCLVGPIVEEEVEPDEEDWVTDEDDREAETFPYPPGYVGATAYWLELHSEKPFRLFAILTSLAIWATLVGRKVRFENQVPILYGLMVATTSNGKDSSIALARTVLEEIGLSTQHLADRLSSWNAGVEKLQEVWPHPVVLSLVDEASGYFAGAAGKSDYGLPDFLKTSWSRGLGTLEPQARVRKSGSARLRPIHRPSFSMLLGAQPSSLGNAIRTAQLEDGLLPRVLWVIRRKFIPIVHEDNVRFSRRLEDSIGGQAILLRGHQLWNWLEGSDRVFNGIDELESMPEESDAGEDDTFRREVWEKPVVFTDEPAARALFHEYMLRTQARIQPAAEGKESPSGFLRGKACENAKRIALILAAVRCGATGGPYTINEAEANWAICFVESTVRAGIEWTKSNMADTPFQQMVQRVLGIIRDAGADGVDRRTLNRRLRHSYPPFKVDEALLSWHESGTIVETSVPTGGAPKKVYFMHRIRRGKSS